MTTPQRERHPAPEVPSSGFASHQAARSDADSTAGDTDWLARQQAVREWLSYASREAIEVFALRHFDRAESAAFLIAEQHKRDRLLAQREASYAVSAALDWSAQSRHPSHAELVRRRSVVA